jgi:DNA primase
VGDLFWYVNQHEYPDCTERELIDKITQDVSTATYWGPPPNLTFLKGEGLVVEPPKPLPALDERQLLAFIPPPRAILAHLQNERKLTREAVDYWELGYSRKAHRVIVPIRARDGRLVAISGRALGEGVNPKYRHTKGFKRDFILYGEDKVEPGRVGYLHEGFFACIYAWQFGYRNNVARMGTHLSGYQEDRLVEWFSKLVIVPDGDNPGMESAGQIFDRVQHRIPTTVAPMPFGSEVDRLSQNELRKVMGSPETVIDTEVAAH